MIPQTPDLVGRHGRVILNVLLSVASSNARSSLNAPTITLPPPGADCTCTRGSAGAWPTLRRLFRLVSIQHCDIKSGKPPREEPGQDELGKGLVCLLPPLCPDDLARAAPTG